MSSECVSFEPHVWTPSKCANCFKPKSEHGAKALAPAAPVESEAVREARVLSRLGSLPSISQTRATLSNTLGAADPAPPKSKTRVSASPGPRSYTDTPVPAESKQEEENHPPPPPALLVAPSLRAPPAPVAPPAPATPTAPLAPPAPSAPPAPIAPSAPPAPATPTAPLAPPASPAGTTVLAPEELTGSTPLPPPMPEPSSIEYSTRDEPKIEESELSKESSRPVETRRTFLEEITQGVRLKTPVALPLQRQDSGDVKTLDSEMVWALRKKQRNDEEKHRKFVDSRIAEMKGELEEIQSRLKLRPLMDIRGSLVKALDFERKVEVSRELLATYVEWPAALISILEHVVDCLDQLNRYTSTSVVHSKHSKKDGDEKKISASRMVNVETLMNEMEQIFKWEARFRNLSAESQEMFPDALLMVFSRTGDTYSKLKTYSASLLNQMFETGEQLFSEISEQRLLKFDVSSRAYRCYNLLDYCTKSFQKLVVLDLVTETPENLDRIAEGARNAEALKSKFSEEIRARSSGTSKAETVELVSAKDKKRLATVVASSADSSDAVLNNCRLQLKEGNLEKYSEALSSASDAQIAGIHQALAGTILRSGDFTGLELLFARIKEKSSCNEWILDAAALKDGVNLIKAILKIFPSGDVNYRGARGGNTALHVMARNSNAKGMSELIKDFGADPTVLNAIGQTPLQVIAANSFGPPLLSELKSSESIDLSPFASYLNNSRLSDVTLATSDGSSFYCHRVILAAQSPVFKAMLDTDSKADSWAESLDESIEVEGVLGKALSTLLEFAYTGAAHFVADDIAATVDILSAASRFLMHRLFTIVENALVRKVASHNAAGLFMAADHLGAINLKKMAANVLLTNYHVIVQDEYAKTTLLKLLCS